MREADDRGRHTLTRREFVALPEGGLLIDSPGIRELQLSAEGTDVFAACDESCAVAASTIHASSADRTIRSDIAGFESRTSDC